MTQLTLYFPGDELVWVYYFADDDSDSSPPKQKKLVRESSTTAENNSSESCPEAAAPPDEKFGRVFKLYADKQKLQVESLVFSFDGDRIDPSATPQSLELEDNATIKLIGVLHRYVGPDNLLKLL